jgi:hypothetical protein
MAKTPAPTTYTHSLEIYVPTQCRCGKPLPEHARTEILDEIKITMAGWFGGNSAKKVDPRVERIEGSWVLGDGTLAKEPVDVVQSFTDDDTLIDQREEFTAYVAQLANRLTQEQMLCRIDGKSILYPSAADPKPHRCAGGVTSATTPKPREAGGVELMLSLQASLQRLGSTNDVRDLFCNILHYDYENGIVPTTAWPDSVKQCLAPGVAPQIIADQNGFKIIYLQLADGSLRKSSERQLVQRLIKDNPGMRGLVVVSDIDQKHWNLVNVKFDRGGKKLDNVLLRRMRVGPGQSVRTAVERLSQVDIESVGEKTTAAELQDLHDKAFDVEAVTKQFFNDVANWYFWALKHVEFPKDAPKEDDGHDHVSLIRLITRLIFCWFLREKGLLPDTLFDRRQLNDILTGFAPDKARNKDSVYYRAILQNLFFATLSTETDKRKWVTDEQNFMAHSLYRFKDCFQKPATALNLFKSIPFLNGGLFECLDRDLGEGKKPRYIRIDGFSRRSDSQPVVPDFLFFGPEREIDLSAEYDDRRFRNVRVRGLIDTLRHYNFTIEENTPIEEEVALDPELCGKVFENLLAAYNPETGTTARKQSGSFYTPREIVNYMVDESLIASLATKLEEEIPTAKEIEPRLRHLFAYNDEPQQFDKKEIKALITAIDTLKTLDPAVGSGAFPMGLLHKLVFILGKLDPRNEQWKERQISRVREAIAVAEKIEDDTIRSRTVEELEQQVANVNESFDRNELDYGRKLYLIENCIYGVDIQPIAVQIAKMRFFISLIVDQNIDDSLPNRGVRPLPNLETKFVAANSIIGIGRPGQQLLRNLEIDSKESELRRVRERHFLARTPKQKAKCRDEDVKLRTAIAELLEADGWDTAVSRRLSSWNPYDQNASADFFDSEWMFGVTQGFNVVIANPPYGVKFKAEEKKYFKSTYKTIVGKYDSYGFFFEKSFDLLAVNGELIFITPHTWLMIKEASSLRVHFLKQGIFRLILILDQPVFESAIVDAVVSQIRRSNPHESDEYSVTHIGANISSPDRSYRLNQLKRLDIEGSPLLAPATGPSAVLIDKIINNSTPLSQRALMCVGVQAYDKYAGQSEEVIKKRIFHSNKKKDKTFRPEIGGKNIIRFFVTPNGDEWISYGDWLAHPRNPWFFQGERIVIREITGAHPRRIVCSLVDDNSIPYKSVLVVKIEDDQLSQNWSHAALTAILNSSLISWILPLICNKQEKKVFPRVSLLDLKKMPIAKSHNSSMVKEFATLTKAQAAHCAKHGEASLTLDKQIDALVYKLYDLSPEEIKLVEESSAR